MAEAHHIAEVVAGIVALVVIALLILAATRRIRLPFTISLVMAGMTLSSLSEAYPHLLPPLHEIELSPGLVIYVFLPVLIFESAFTLDARMLRRNLLPVLILAVPGLLLSTTLIGLLVSWATGISLSAALLLGAILSATDPVAVVALFKKLGAPTRLTVLVEGESLFNDASAIVLSRIILGVVMGGVVTMESVGAGVGQFLYVFFGGLVVGAVLATLTGFFLGWMESDQNVEITLSGVLAYASFLVAEEFFHASGVMATIAAAITFSSHGMMKLSAEGRRMLEHFWEYAGFLANALIFLLVGLRVNLFAIIEARTVVLWVILVMLVSRGAVVYGLLPLAEKLTRFEAVDSRFRHVMFWGGLRGAIALALVLSLPEFEHRDLFVTITIGAVLFTLLVQGLSIEGLVRRLKLDVPPLADRVSRLEGDLAARQKALARLPTLLAGGLFSGAVGEHVLSRCESELREMKEQVESLRHTELDRNRERQLLQLRCLTEEQSLYMDLFNHGQISEPAFARLLAVLGERIDSLRYGGVGASPLTTNWWALQQEKLLARMARWPGVRRCIEPLRRRLIARDYELNWAHYQGTRRNLDLIDELARLEAMADETVARVRQDYEEQTLRYRHQLDLTAEQFPEFVSGLHERLGRRLLLVAEMAVVEDRAEHGVIPQVVAEKLAEELRGQIRQTREPFAPIIQCDPVALLQKVPLFAEMPVEELPPVADRLEPLSIREGEDVVTEGEKGRSMFLIARGVVRVQRRGEGPTQELATLLAGDFFGEIALLRGEPRSATVRAVTPCSLYELSREDLRALMEENPSFRESLKAAEQKRHAQLAAAGSEPGELIRGARMFQDLSPAAMDALAARLKERRFEEHEIVFRQGDDAQALYFIGRGVVRVMLETRGHERHLATLTQGDIFGEGGLLHQRKRGATVHTISPCTLHEIRRADLIDLTGAYPEVAQTLTRLDQSRKDDTDLMRQIWQGAIEG
ncbi:MAG: cation:proton antiporter [Limisphaerales bacterium]